MAKPQKVSNPKMFTATWQEKDDALLTELLQTKIKELKWEIKMATSPYMARQLKIKRQEYRVMLKKVSLGQYDGNIILNELASAVRYQQGEKQKKEKVLSKYVSSYADVDFDFESYFSRTRYFGGGLPFFTLILIGIMFFCFMMGAIMPKQTNSINDTIGNLEIDIWLDISTVGYLKIGNDAPDFKVKNDGNWPRGKYKEGVTPLAQGRIYINAMGDTPEYVALYQELGMIAVDITVMDVVKAFFKMPAILKTTQRIDFIEDLPILQGTSWFYQGFMRDSESLEIKKIDGKYDGATIVRNIATYGTIICLLIAIISMIIVLIACIVRMFTYTTKKVHFFTFLTFFSALLALILPAFAKIQSFGDISSALTSYFIFGEEAFITSKTTTMSFNIVSVLLILLPFIAMWLPLMFKNKVKYQITYVPKGNKPPFDPAMNPDKLRENRLKQKQKNKKSKKKGVATLAPQNPSNKLQPRR